MLDNERIREAERNVKGYLGEGLMKKVGEPDKNILSVLGRNSEESLETADFLFKNNMSLLWVVVCSYYSMYYAANEVLYRYGYKIGHKISHKITSDALIVFVRSKLKERLLEEYEEAKGEAFELANLKTNEIIESFDFERDKRSRFQYEMTDTIKRSKAETSLERAKRFVFEMKKLLAE